MAVAFDGERMWWVRGPEGEVESCALAMSEGTVMEFDRAEAALRVVLRPSDAWWRVAPRVVVAVPRAEIPKRGVRDIVVYAGARDVITLPKVMAAALGAGLEVDAERMTTVLYVERDWVGFAVIRKAEILAGWERAGGVEQLLEDVAAEARAAGAREEDFERLRAQLVRTGLGDTTAKAGATRFVEGLRERCRRVVGGMPEARQREWRGATLYLLGPYAGIPGLRELVATSWGCAVIVPSEPERAVIYGCRKVLGELDWIMRAPPAKGEGP